MKVYYEAGLKPLAMSSGFRAETLKSLANASNFKRTHAFLMQVWEAFVRQFYEQYMMTISSGEDCDWGPTLELIKTKLLQSNEECMKHGTFDKYADLTISLLGPCRGLYDEFVEGQAKLDDNWRFWCGFVFHDCLAYVGLYFAIRGGVWGLRMASLKEMCPLFTAYDRVNYLKILPQHFAEVMCLPDYVRQCLEQSGFVCMIKGNEMHAVALDEAHETLINKHIKTSVVRPSKEYLDRNMYYYPVRAKTCDALKEQVSPPVVLKKSFTIFDRTPHASFCEENVRVMVSMLDDWHVSDVVTENRGLQTIDGSKQATPEQCTDLLVFRGIGQEYYEALIL